MSNTGEGGYVEICDQKGNMLRETLRRVKQSIRVIKLYNEDTIRRGDDWTSDDALE